MISRRVLLAGGIVLPVVVLGWLMKVAASWRPVAMGKVSQANLSRLSGIWASERFVLVDVAEDGLTLFDLKNSSRSSLSTAFQAGGVDGDFVWEWNSAKKTPNGFTVRGRSPYQVPIHLWESNSYPAQLGRIAPDLSRIEMLSRDWFCRWDGATHKLERAVRLPFEDEAVTLSRDGEAVVAAGWDSFTWVSTHTGRTIKTVPLVGFKPFEYKRLSEYGTYALYDAAGGVNGPRQNVVETRNGRLLWSCEMESWNDTPIFSRDEQLAALPFPSRHIWQLRELRTGKTVRELPLVPETQGATLSPDGGTLYSVANGVLYRQRTR